MEEKKAPTTTMKVAPRERHHDEIGEEGAKIRRMGCWESTILLLGEIIVDDLKC